MLVLAAAFIGYAAWWRGVPATFNDSGSYMHLAQDLSDLSLGELHERTPGYPILLLLTGSADQPTRQLFLLSLVIYLAGVWMLAALLRDLGVGPRMVGAFVVVVLLPPFVEHTFAVMTETLTQVMLVGGFVALLKCLSQPRPRWLVFSGLALTYAGLTKPTYEPLPVVLAVVLTVMAFFRLTRPFPPRHLLVSAAGLFAAWALIIGGYSVANYRANGYYGTTAPLLGFALSTRTVPFVERLPDEYAAVREVLISHRDATLVKRNSGHLAQSYMNMAREDLTAATQLEGVELGQYLTRMQISLVLTAPLHYLHEVARTMVTFWFPGYGTTVGYPRGLPLLWTAVHFGLIGLFALQLVVVSGVALYEMSGRVVGGGSRPVVQPLLHADAAAPYLLALGLIVYTMLFSSLLGTGDARYRVPVDGLLVFVTVLGLHRWWRSTASGAARTEKAGGSLRP